MTGLGIGWVSGDVNFVIRREMLGWRASYGTTSRRAWLMRMRSWSNKYLWGSGYPGNSGYCDTAIVDVGGERCP